MDSDNGPSSPRGPKFALISLHKGADVGGLFSLLISNGYSNVTFLNSVTEHADVNQYVNERINAAVRAVTLPESRSPISNLKYVISVPKPANRIQPAQSSKTATPQAASGSSHTRNDAHRGTSMTSDKSDDAPSATPPPKVPNSTGAIPCPSSLHAQKVKSEKNENEELFVYCKLCDNKLMATRLSNLTNHVRRHAANKQWSCAHCPYQHNEQAKVRVHMSHQHQDVESQPVDNLTPEMQQCWNALMDECFPGHQDNNKFRMNLAAERKRRLGLQSANTGSETGQEEEQDCDPITSALLKLTDSATSSIKTTTPPPVSDNHAISTATLSSLDDIVASTLHNCSVCTTAVPFIAPHGRTHFIAHIKEKHLDQCVLYRCDICLYMNYDQHNVGEHIISQHSNEQNVTMTEVSANEDFNVIVPKFFPSAADLFRDVSEEQDSVDNSMTPSLVERENGTSMGEDLLAKVKRETETIEEESENRRSQNGYEIDFNFDSDVVLPKDRIGCALCGKVLTFLPNSLGPLIVHAKRHYCMKQFECPECPFSSVDVALVRTHIASKHGNGGVPINHNNEVMQTAWVQVMIKCFPDLTKRVENANMEGADLKEPKLEVEPEDESDPSGNIRKRSATPSTAGSEEPNGDMEALETPRKRKGRTSYFSKEDN